MKHLLWCVALSAALPATAAPCDATALPGVGGAKVQAWRLADGAVAAWSGMNINIDGYGRAYHPDNRAAGAVLHLCVGGRVHLPDGSRYEGSENNATCTGKFMADVGRIAAAGWSDPAVGVVEWYGIAATGAAQIGGRTVRGVKPVLQRDGSGFYVSPTSLVDSSMTDLADQRRYVNPLRVAAAVVPRSLVQAGVKLGSHGVAVHTTKNIAVPFVVGDGGPRIGEGSPALARQVAGLAPTDQITLQNRYAGQVDGPAVLWVFFAGPALPFQHTQEAEVAVQARAAFEQWGGADRLAACTAALPRP